MNKEYSVLLLPGWQNSDADHWQSRWEQAHGYQRVQQHNWQQPLRGDWTVQLNEAVLAAPTAVVLVAHSLGCIFTALCSPLPPPAVLGNLQAALPVAPSDVDHAHLPHSLPHYAPLPLLP